MSIVLGFVADYGSLLFGAGVALLGWLFHRQAWARIMLERLGVEVRAVVLEVEQTYVDEINRASANGELTPDERRCAFAMALDRLRQNLGAKGLRRLARIIGLNSDEMHGLLGTRVEAAVQQLTIEKGQRP